MEYKLLEHETLIFYWMRTYFIYYFYLSIIVTTESLKVNIKMKSRSFVLL